TMAGALYLRFLFQAEDGIRDRNVTGVQTCALPISPAVSNGPPAISERSPSTEWVIGSHEWRRCKNSGAVSMGYVPPAADSCRTIITSAMKRPGGPRAAISIWLIIKNVRLAKKLRAYTPAVSAISIPTPKRTKVTIRLLWINAMINAGVMLEMTARSVEPERTIWRILSAGRMRK